MNTLYTSHIYNTNGFEYDVEKPSGCIARSSLSDVYRIAIGGSMICVFIGGLATTLPDDSLSGLPKFVDTFDWIATQHSSTHCKSKNVQILLFNL